jgi:hypothetical protein
VPDALLTTRKTSVQRFRQLLSIYVPAGQRARLLVTHTLAVGLAHRVRRTKSLVASPGEPMSGGMKRGLPKPPDRSRLVAN